MLDAKKTMAIFLTSLALLLFVGQGTAQNRPMAQAKIPFEFWITGNRLPAGDYRIEYIESRTYIMFRSADGKIVQEAYTLPLDDDPAKASDAKLVFRVQDGKHYLYGGWGPYGKSVVTAESVRPAPSDDNRVEVPLSYR
jgi:hypothetical protein